MKKLTIILIAASLAAMITIPATALETRSPNGLISDVYEENDVYVEDQIRSVNRSAVSMAPGEKKDLLSKLVFRFQHPDVEEPVRLASELSWKSSNPDVASVDARGLATAHKTGVAVITAIGFDDAGERRVQIITVGVTQKQKESAENSFELSEGERLDLTQLAKPQIGSDEVAWASSVPEIVSINKDGLLKARSVGRCTVTATSKDESGDDRVVKYRLRVITAALDGITKNSTLLLKKGDAVDLGKLYYPHYQGLPALNSFSVEGGNRDILSVSDLSVSVKTTGSAAVFIHGKTDEGSIVYHKVKVISEG